MPSKKYQKLLELANMGGIDRKGAHGTFPIRKNALDRRLNTGESVTFEGQIYYSSGTRPHSHLKEG